MDPDFPDGAHLLQLGQDLWAWPKSRAAVMVGAGFSLNAEPLPGASTCFPLWKQLTRAMFDELHPTSAADSKESAEKRKIWFAGMNALRIASEYEATFGRRKLEELIRRETPDPLFRPGELHGLLLQLPWSDVFTTNYDTLLERTDIDGRNYQPVTTTHELTTTVAPRIVKLHGSLPSQTPFIVTEEDYRSYPRRFAPFVNTVRQSLIENTFVLLGFSGDDPNFLEWTGWIRDELGEHHAPIYLVGPLRSTNAERSLLKSRGVTPIDLSPVFPSWSPEKIHTDSLEWFLRSLHAQRPARPENWPMTGVSFSGRLPGKLPRLFLVIRRHLRPFLPHDLKFLRTTNLQYSPDGGLRGSGIPAGSWRTEPDVHSYGRTPKNGFHISRGRSKTGLRKSACCCFGKSTGAWKPHWFRSFRIRSGRSRKRSTTSFNVFRTGHSSLHGRNFSRQATRTSLMRGSSLLSGCFAKHGSPMTRVDGTP